MFMPALATLCLSFLADPSSKTSANTSPQRFARRWVFAHPGFDLRRADETDKLVELIVRSKKAGYNGVCIGTYRLVLPTVASNEHLANIERVRKAAEEAGIELILDAMKINGYSNSALANNPNLAPGLPVRDCVFRVRDGKAAIADGANLLQGDFEAFSSPNRPDGWDWTDLPGQVAVEDRSIRHSGTSSLRMEHFETASTHGNCRLFKKLKVKPWHQYHFRAWIKTEDVKRPESIRFRALGNVDQGGRVDLQMRSIDVRATQDWTAHDAVFNSLHNAEVWLYLGGWNPGGGKIWIDDVSLRETAGINLLRRATCPIRVTSEDGTVQYQEERDFERWEYATMGCVPYAGRYEIAHPEPPIVLTKASRIREGQRLEVSYYHTLMHFNAGVGICLSDDQVFEILERHLKVVKKLFRPKTYLMVQDEVRLACWCEQCSRQEATTGQVLAKCVRRCTDLIHREDPAAEIVSWSDMFDPFHNAVDNYWQTRATVKGSWEGLAPNVIVANWNQGRAKQSLNFFAERGHRQLIATYYDRSNWQQVVRNWLNAADGVPYIDGIIYTTWSNDYRRLEEFLDLVESH